MREYSDYGYYAVAFYDTQENRMLPDWDSYLKIELRDYNDVLQFTATINSSPALQQGTDNEGVYVYINNIDLTNWSLGEVKARVYAKKDGVNIEPYPLYATAFRVVADEPTTSAVFLGELSTPDLLADIRDYIRDKPELNRLISGHETKARTFIQAIQKTVSLINSTPPMGVSTINIVASGENRETEVYIVTYPTDFKSILMDGIVLEILKSLMYYKNRNKLNYSDGQVSIQEEDLNAHMQVYNILRQEFYSELRKYKRFKNINNLLSDTNAGLGTDYSYFYNVEYYERLELE